MHEMPGKEGCMMYHIVLVGGPRDGELLNSFRPYDMLKNPDGVLYAAAEEGEACLEWVDDWTRKITLHYRPEVGDD